MSERGQDALKVLGALVLEGGRRWGDVAQGWQLADAEAVLDPAWSQPRMHFLTRPRGGSKTTDLAGMLIAAMLFQLGPQARAYAVSSDRDQSRLLIDAISGFVLRTPGLAQVLTVERYAVKTSAGAVLEVLSADAPSAYGLRPSFIVCDELAVWPSGAQQLWTAVISSMPKVAGSRLVCLTSAGDPAHWSFKVRERAAASDRWTLHEVPGPVPWLSADALDEQRSLLTDSQYRRLHLNQWTASEDRLTTPADVRACIGHSGALAPSPDRRYHLGLDIGLVSDRTVLTCCHLERRPLGPTVVLDRSWVWQGRKDAPVSLAAVEEVTLEAARQYRAPLSVDPYQAVHLAQRLRAAGARVNEFTFSSASVGRLALTLYRLLRDHTVDLPDDQALLDELARVRLLEVQPGQYRIDHDHDGHDDRVISLALCAQALLEKGQLAHATISSPARLMMPATPIARSGGGDARLGDRSGGRRAGGRVLTPRDLRHLPGPHRR